MVYSEDFSVSAHSPGADPSAQTAPVAAPRVGSTKLVTLARIAYLVGVFLLLAGMGPASLPSQLLKPAVFCGFLAISAILFCLGGGLRELLRAPGKWRALAIFALPIAYGLSWWYSADRSVALIGVGSEVDTVLSMLVGALAFFLGFALFRRERHVKMLLTTAAGAIVVAGLFQYVILFFNLLGDRSINLVGKWDDFGILMALGGILLLARLELGPMRRSRKVVAAICLALIGILCIAVQFNVIWWVLLVAGVLFGAARLMRSDTRGLARFPWFGGATVVVSIIMLVFAGWITAHALSPFSLPPLEVRPAFSSTLEAAVASHANVGRWILGTGPNTFQTEWMINKPLSVNETPFWSLDFTNGFSVLATAAVTVGILGLLAWLIPLILLLISLARIIRARHSFANFSALTGLVSGGLFLWLMVLLYAASQDIALFTFILAGAAWGVASRFSISAAAEASAASLAFVRPSRIAAVGSAVVALVLVVVTVYPAVTTARQFLSYTYEQEATNALSGNKIGNAAALDQKSQNVELTGDNLRLGIAIEFAEMQQLASASTTPATVSTMRQQFQSALEGAIKQAEREVGCNPATPTCPPGLHPNDYQAYAQLGEVYEFLVPPQVAGAYDHGVSAYQAAMKLAPKNPTLPLLLARLEATDDLKTNLSSVQNLVNQSLALKSNYTDALLFKEQLAVSENDLSGATKAAEGAVASSPQDPTLWFELGLFYYTGTDYTDAVTALKNAVTLESDYANAKYFLGLAEYKTGNSKDAIQQFNDLEKTNPNNAEVKLVLSNMQASVENPFQGETPPEPPPQTRTTAPVSESSPAKQP
ncbi:MAG: tetratricopeptide repeat protein [Minisyncoccia bacterium]